MRYVPIDVFQCIERMRNEHASGATQRFANDVEEMATDVRIDGTQRICPIVIIIIIIINQPRN